MKIEPLWFQQCDMDLNIINVTKSADLGDVFVVAAHGNQVYPKVQISELVRSWLKKQEQ